MPDFYSAAILEKAYCFDPFWDVILKKMGTCRSMAEWGYSKQPTIEECTSTMFYQYYSSPEQFSMSRAVFYNENQLQDFYVRYVAKVAEALQGNPYVVGIDPLNEPFPVGHTFEDFIRLVEPKAFDREVLGPLYARILSAVDKIDKDSVIMFEPG